MRQTELQFSASAGVPGPRHAEIPNHGSAWHGPHRRVACQSGIFARRLGVGGVRRGAFGAARPVRHGWEDELMRALGTAGVMSIIDAQGELDSFRIFQNQPAQQCKATHAQMRRFMGTRAGRKIRYGTLLVEALDIELVPRALNLVLAPPK